MFLFKLKWPSILILSLKDTLTNIDHVSLTKNQIFLLKCPQAIFFMKKLEKTEEDIFGALKKRKDAKKTKSNKNSENEYVLNAHEKTKAKKHLQT